MFVEPGWSSVDEVEDYEEILDLFCGGGGSGSGMLRAYELMQQKVRGTFVNHWSEAIKIHSFNHPTHRHFCTGVDNVDPYAIFKRGQKLRTLWASPECTHHSVARGGKPVNAQSRATAWCVVRWIRHKRPLHVLIENVAEFRDWGPLKQKRKNGLLVWVKSFDRKTGEPINGTLAQASPTSKSKRIKRIEVTSVPFKQSKGEGKWDYMRRLAEVGYEMALEADKSHKRETFDNWVRELRRMGYHVDWKILCSADYGDPTTRKRLFVQATRVDSGKKIVWPNPTHGNPKKKGGLAPGLKPWRTAREIIDWDNLGESIFERARPLVAKTIHRIIIGLIRYGLKDFLVPQNDGFGGQETRSVDDPVSTITANHRGERLIRPESYIIPQHAGYDNDHVLGIDQPLPTTTGAGAERLATPEVTSLDPYLVTSMGKSTAQSADEPLNAVLGQPKHHVANPCLVKMKGTGTVEDPEEPLTTVGASGLYHALMQSFLMATDQQGSNGPCVYPTDEPVKTTITKQNQAVVTLEPSILQTAHGVDHRDEGRRVKSADAPIGAVAAGGTDYAVSTPQVSCIVPNFGERAGQEPRHHNVDKPLPTPTGHGAGGLATANITRCDAITPGADRGDAENAAGRAGSVGAADSVRDHTRPAEALSATTPTVDADSSADSHGDQTRGDATGPVLGDHRPYATLQPYLVDTAHTGDDRVRDILEPLMTVCGNRGGVAVIRPWIYTYYSSGGVGADIDAPLPTSRTKESQGLCYPVLKPANGKTTRYPVLEIDGKFFILDVRFRMLTYRELARAQGFPDDYEFPSTITDAVKAIGNSVSNGVATALTLAAESQDPDIMHFFQQ